MRYARFILIGTVLALLPAALWAQAVKLTAPPAPDRGVFGFSVDLEGDYAVVGAPFDDIDKGAVYVFFKDPVRGWTQQARLTNNDRIIGDAFGISVDLDGSFLLIGAPGGGDEGGHDAGAAYVFFNDPVRGWMQQARLTARDPASEDRYGYVVALSGIFALVAAPFDDDDGHDSGAVYVYAFNGSSRWQYQDKLTAPSADADDNFGKALALDDETALVGAPNADEPRGRKAGLAYVFARSAGSSWIVRAVLTAGDAATENHFGTAIAVGVDPMTGLPQAVIGAPNARGRSIGSAYVFTEQDMLWTQVQQLIPDEADSGDNIGSAVALHGAYALIGAPDAEAGVLNTAVGAAYLFVNDPGIGWHQRATLTSPDAVQNACFACAVAFDDGHFIVGAWGEDGTVPNVGAAYVFDRSTIFTRFEDPPESPSSLIAPINYPNPFRHTTTIAFEVPEKSAGHQPARLAIYDILGREVAVLVNHPLRPGRHEIAWTAAGLPSGVYAYQVTIGDQTQTRRMLRVR